MFWPHCRMIIPSLHGLSSRIIMDIFRYKEGTNVQNCVTEDHFRRKPQRQVMRDRHRSQQWQASRRSYTDGGQHSDQTTL